MPLDTRKLDHIRGKLALAFAGRSQPLVLHLKDPITLVVSTRTIDGVIRGQEDTLQTSTATSLTGNALAELRVSDIDIADLRTALYITLPADAPNSIPGDQFNVINIAIKGMMPGGDRYLLTLNRTNAAVIPTPTGGDPPQPITLTYMNAGVPTTITTNAILQQLREGYLASAALRFKNQLLLTSADVTLTQLRNSIYLTVLGEKYHIQDIETAHAGLLGATYTLTLVDDHAQSIDLTLKATDGSTSVKTVSGILADLDDNDPTEGTDFRPDASLQLRTAEISLAQARQCIFLVPTPTAPGQQPANRYLIEHIAIGGTLAGGDRLICTLTRQR